MNLIESIRNTFHPEHYKQEIKAEGSCKLCLQKGRFISRYVLAVFELNNDQSLELQIKNARDCIKKATNAIWFFREVGAYIIFTCDTETGNLNIEDIPVDKTGVNAVIVQGVHIIGSGGYHKYNHTEWFGRTLGGTKEVASRLEAIST
tara:strand:- start:58 stop:501 length:444 start_codon:yes stop_codon:yes gene_type:complete